MADKNYFEILSSVNVGDKIESKNGLSYLSWPFAWSELKKRFPDSTYTVYENERGWNYFTDDSTCWVKTGVTVNGIEHIEYLPIMDNKNRSIPLGSVTSYDVNKSIQRSLTKAVARHGLGLYVYAGEDLPSDSDATEAPKRAATKKAPAKPQPKAQPQPQPTADQAPNYLAELRQFLIAHNIDPKIIVNACNLTPGSTNDEWAAALAYAKAYVGGPKS